MNTFKYLAYLAVFTPVSALAQESAQDDGGEVMIADTIRDSIVTVIASGSPVRLDQIGQSISVIGADELRSIQGPDLARVLERLPGVMLTRNGGLGSFTGLRLRGANAEQVLVLVDGIRVADVAAPSGGFDFGTLAASGIGRVEVLRGSNSVTWGSEAIGGVISAASRRLTGAEVSAEYGSNDTFDGQASAGLDDGANWLTLNGGYTRTDGISSAAVGTEADGMRQWRIGGSGELALSSSFALTGTARYADSRLDIDGFPAPTYSFADTPEFQKTRQFAARGGFRYQGEALSINGGFARTDTRRSYFDPTYGSEPNYQTKGQSDRAEIRGDWTLGEGLKLDFGADHEWSRFSSTYDARKKASAASAHALLGWHYDGLNLSAGARLDDHSRFGSELTFGANGSVALAANWRVRASYGEGFKTPTLFQLFSDYGNGALNPERSRSYDLGIETGDRNNGTFHAALTAFRRDTRAQIDYVSCFRVTTGICANRPFGTYDNIGKARAEGFEVELGAQMSDRFRAQAVYSYAKSVNRTPGDANRGNALSRRPRHAVTMSADWRSPLHDLAFGADIRMVSDSFDDPGNFTRIDGHALVTLRASLPVSEGIELYGRVENLTDAGYETAAGYGAPGRTAFIGARARF